MKTAVAAPQTKTAPPELEVINLTKRFGTFTALDQVSIKVTPGSFHALLGENGAGKSTLVKCIMGFYTPTSGDVLVAKQSRTIASPKDAHHFGIGMVYQHFTSVPAMTVAENLVLSRYDSPQWINWKTEYDRLDAFMATSPFQIDLRTPISQLAAGQKQKLEILKQLYLNSRVLILDEPTSVLTPDEADEVLGLLREEVTAGHLSVLMISHKFREVMAFTDEVTVLRKGKLAGHGYVRDLTVDDMAHMMLGEKKEATPVAKVAIADSRPVLELKDLCADRDNGLPAVCSASLIVNSGEIVGIAGVSGNGQRPRHSGDILVNGEPYQPTRREMARHQVYTLPEEPLRNACVPHMSVAENMALRTFDCPPQARHGWLLSLSNIRRMAEGLVQRFSVKTPSVDTPVGHLSGGNVQRTVLARELSSTNINLLIAANPCFGLDFSAVDYIHSQILAARNRGVAVLLVSEDLDELLKLSDRIFVISTGELVYESPTATADIKTLGHKMAGH
ncbi:MULTISPECIES: ABC transporter ATP-binding protein [Cyanophyceae]|uniref:ABC transporter ATP-binding protein n=1 Tax=Cyanophyceae TaxID=3028117 RepID=UPI0016889176|nr:MULTISPECIES: ABC transporter ATP-binding protein [Cyanophyceae]MBD1915197.1 ABC transporter ATP-binding protein [Phormidium sp. FACHB-77]MBD2032526.1 ABC transporter ATP-binding protein [Phormidium sp. FACHB-322]MBD2050943.1 ABC transporter ATP-binding protein [Leptolyngbya sp. FACHB-60]